jgi:hypothetical protein
MGLSIRAYARAARIAGADRWTDNMWRTSNNRLAHRPMWKNKQRTPKHLPVSLAGYDVGRNGAADACFGRVI